ncbi:hypothetical protein BGZ47_007825, partial [Haplosporangium gracile]
TLINGKKPVAPYSPLYPFNTNNDTVQDLDQEEHQQDTLDLKLNYNITDLVSTQFTPRTTTRRLLHNDD